jgi:hypothetical protein
VYSLAQWLAMPDAKNSLTFAALSDMVNIRLRPNFDP